MAMQFEELDEETRRWMLDEFEQEWARADRYEPRDLTREGLREFPDALRRAIAEGTEIDFQAEMYNERFWQPTRPAWNGRARRVIEQRVNIGQACATLTRNEFNTWYVRGLAGRLQKEGVSRCQVYRAAWPQYQPAECAFHEGEVRAVQEIYDNHRARYWPTENPSIFSIPYVPGCHHTIRRYA